MLAYGLVAFIGCLRYVLITMSINGDTRATTTGPFKGCSTLWTPGIRARNPVGAWVLQGQKPLSTVQIRAYRIKVRSFTCNNVL